MNHLARYICVEAKIRLLTNDTIPKTNNKKNAMKMSWKPEKEEIFSSKHHFSGANMLVSMRVFVSRKPTSQLPESRVT